MATKGIALDKIKSRLNKGDDIEKERNRLKGCFQREVARDCLKTFLDSWEHRVEHKLKRWKIDGLRRKYRDIFIHNLANLQKLVAPRVAAAVWGMAWNRWCTARRFQGCKPCLLGCGNGEDSIEHYIGCSIGREVGSRLLRVEDCYEGRKCSMMGASKYPSAQKQTCWAVLVYGLYMATNFRRYNQGSMSPREESVQEVMQFCRRAVEGHPKSCKILHTLWSS